MSARLEIVAKPGARVAGISRRAGDVVVAVRDRAIDGKANDAIVHAVAGWLDVAPGRVRILHGGRGRRKLVEIQGIDDDAIRARVDALPATGP